MNLKNILIVSALLSQNIFCSERKEYKRASHLPLYISPALEGDNTKLEQANYIYLRNFIFECNKNIEKFTNLKGHRNKRRLAQEQLKLREITKDMQKMCPQILSKINEESAKKPNSLAKIVESLNEIQEEVTQVN